MARLVRNLQHCKNTSVVIDKIISAQAISKPARVFLSLGSNLRNRATNITNAINLLNQSAIKITRISPIYETKPVGKITLLGLTCPFNIKQSDFLNCVVEGITYDEPMVLLTKISKIEKLLGRTRFRPIRNLARIIDIDILFYDDKIINQAMLKIPHPRIQERAFVLLPLSDLEPNFIHPTLNKTVQQLSECVDKKGVRLWQRTESTVLV